MIACSPPASDHAAGDAAAGDAASLQPLHVFVTTDTMLGKGLVLHKNNRMPLETGVKAGDEQCAFLAKLSPLSAIQLAPRWMAWLSSPTPDSTPATRFPSRKGEDAKRSYEMLKADGSRVLVASDWNNLVGGSLKNPINIDETGTQQGADWGGSFWFVWTGTKADGTFSGKNALDWSSKASNQNYATIGRAYDDKRTTHSLLTDKNWTEVENVESDWQGGHLYCFEQP